MSGSQSVAGPLIYGVPLALWIAVGVALLSAIVTLTERGAVQPQLEEESSRTAQAKCRGVRRPACA